MSKYELYLKVDRKQRKLIRRLPFLLFKEWMKGVCNEHKQSKKNN